MNAIKNRQFTAMLELFQKMPETYEIPTMNSVAERIQQIQSIHIPVDYENKPVTIQINKHNTDEITYLQELFTGSSLTKELPLSEQQVYQPSFQSPSQLQESKGKVIRDPLSQCIYDNYCVVAEYPTSQTDVYVHLLLDTIEPLIACMNTHEKTNLIHSLKVECLGLFKKEEYYRRETYTPRDFKLVELDKTVDTKQPFTLGMTKCLADVLRVNLVFIEQTSHGCYDIQYATRLDPVKVSIVLYASEQTIVSVAIRPGSLLSGKQVFRLVSPFLPNVEDIVNSPKVLLPTLQNVCKLYNIHIKSQSSSCKRSVRTASELIEELKNLLKGNRVGAE